MSSPTTPDLAAEIIAALDDAERAKIDYAADPVRWANDEAGVHLWSKQREVIESVRDNRRTAVHSCHNVGKGLALGTPMPTPHGWTTMGAVCTGDQLIDESGKPCTVLYVSPVREIDCYEVRFSTGETIVCDGDHLWELIPGTARRPQVEDWRDAWDRAKTVSARDIDVNARYRLPITRPIQGVSSDLPLDPYLLGAWLGDGHKHALKLTLAEEDQEIAVRCAERSGWALDITKHAPRRQGYKTLITAKFTEPGGDSTDILRRLGVYAKPGTRSAKRVPESYLRAPVRERQALLAGLMDTDGTVSADGKRITFTQVDEALARDVFELVASLGIKVGMQRCDKFVQYLDERVTSWTVTLDPSKGVNPFLLRRKAARVDLRTGSARSTAVRIMSITPVETVPTRCITVDSPRSLYLAGRSMLPTHNTFTAAVTAAWWIAAHKPGEAFVLSTAPTAPQVKALLWREIGRLHGRANLFGRVNLTEWYIPNEAGGEELVAFGRTTSKDNEAAFQGVHSKYVLVILDEASGVDPKIWQAAESIASNRLSRILAIGNPDLPHSPLATACRDESPYNVIHIGIEHAPATTGETVPEELLDYLISPEWAADMLLEWGEESALYQAKVLGHFPTGAADPWRVISEIHAAACRYIEPAYDPDAVRVGGLDVGAGGDRTVLVERVNDAVGRIETFTERDPEAAAEKLADVIRRWGLIRVNVDTIGVGWGLAGMLRKELKGDGIPIESVKFSDRSNYPKRFYNLRAEAWWHGRELSRDRAWSLAQLDDNAVAELTMPRYVEKNGKILIEPKEDVKERLGRSPDIADAVLLAFFDGIWIPPVSDARGAFDAADLFSGGSNMSGIFPGSIIPGMPSGVPTSLMRR